MIRTITENFDESCQKFPGNILFERPGQTAITYAEASDQVHRFANVLHEIGIRPGDRVAAQVAKSPQAVLLYLACLKIGGVYLPLNTAYTSAEVDYFLGDAEPSLFVCSPDKFEVHSHRITTELAVESLGANGDGSLRSLSDAVSPKASAVHRMADDLAAILYTSGTTGRSKGAMLTHGNLASNCAVLIDAWRFTENDRLIHALPIFHTHGLFVACNMTVSVGATMIFLPRFDPDVIIDEMADATVLMGVPTFYTRLLQSQRIDPLACAGMRLFVSGSAPLSKEVHRAFIDRTGHAILERYGMTETCMIASNPFEGERRPGAVGFPLPGVEVRIMDRGRGVQLSQGEVGAIEVRGPNVFKGYWQMPEKTAAEMRHDGFFVTGDLGMFDADGYLRIVGRDKDLVITGGYNVYPKEIETLLDELPYVAESAVIGVPHPDLGESVIAIVVPKADSAPDTAIILAAISDKLARYKRPKSVQLVEELPRNVMGKVQKNELRARFSDLYMQADASSIPRGEAVSDKSEAH